MITNDIRRLKAKLALWEQEEFNNVAMDLLKAVWSMGDEEKRMSLIKDLKIQYLRRLKEVEKSMDDGKQGSLF